MQLCNLVTYKVPLHARENPYYSTVNHIHIRMTSETTTRKRYQSAANNFKSLFKSLVYNSFNYAKSTCAYLTINGYTTVAPVSSADPQWYYFGSQWSSSRSAAALHQQILVFRKGESLLAAKRLCMFVDMEQPV